MTTKIVKILRNEIPMQAGLRWGLTIITLLFVSMSNLDAQCAMCKAGLHSNLQNGGNQGLGMNAGIMSLMMMPYLLVGGIAYMWYRNRKKGVDEGETIELREIGA